MTLLYDAVGPSAAGAASAATPFQWSHTITGAANTLLVAVACDVDAAAITSVTWGAGTLVPLFPGALNYKHSNSAAAGWLAVFKLVNAPAGTNNVVVDMSGNSTVEGGSLSFSGSDTSVGIGTPQFNTSAASAALSFTPTTVGNIIAAFTVNGLFINSANAPLTSRFINNTGGSNAGGQIAGATAASTGSAMTLGWNADADWSAIVAVEVLVGGGVAATSVLASGTGSAKNATVQTSNVTVGPMYASGADDLGGGSGIWSTPQYAEGGP